jgi:hypothetical protein
VTPGLRGALYVAEPGCSFNPLLAGNPAVNQAFDSYGLPTCGSSS